METVKEYAIIDAAAEPDFDMMMQRYDPPCSCLYADPVQPEMVLRAPYLVEVSPDLKKSLTERAHRPWGIYLLSRETMRNLRHHLRKYLQVQIPDQEKPVYFRYYDPRVIWHAVAIMDDWQLFRFIQPIEKLATNYQAQYREDTFQALKQKYPSEGMAARKMLTFNSQQYAQFDHIALDNYLNQLTDKLLALWDKNGVDLMAQRPQQKQLLTRVYDYCQNQQITDDRSFQLLIELLVHRQILRFEDIPPAWLLALSQNGKPGGFRVTSLVLTELGHIPAYNNKE